MALTIQDIRDQLGDVDGVHWKDAEISKAISETGQTWQALTAAERITYPVYTAASTTSYYSVPTRVCCPYQVTYVTASGSSVLTPSSIHELDQLFPGWEGLAAGTPKYWAPIGIRQFAVYPRPTVLGNQQFSPYFAVYGMFSRTTQERAEAADVDFIGYTCHTLNFKEAGAEFKATSSDLEAFAAAAALKNAMLKKLSFYRKAMGLQRDETQNPARVTPSTAIGVRRA